MVCGLLVHLLSAAELSLAHALLVLLALCVFSWPRLHGFDCFLSAVLLFYEEKSMKEKINEKKMKVADR